MALGGGIWLVQNKILPGTYINFVSKEKPIVDMVDRGYATMALELDWGPSGEIFRVEMDEFQKNSQSIFGYDYAHDKLKGLRDLFLHLKTGYFYRLNSDGEKATNTFATARYAGTRGNDITVAVQSDPDADGKFVVYTYLITDGVTKTVDKQTGIGKISELEDNEYITFNSTATLTVTAASKLTGGTNGSQVTAADYQSYLELIEPYYYNVMAYPGADASIKTLLYTFIRRIRESTSLKAQLVAFDIEANHEGVISINKNNAIKDSGYEAGSVVYWVAGAEASCPINETVGNMIYDGEFTLTAKMKQYELEQAITKGQFTFHVVTDPASGDVNGDIRVLKDINTFTEFSKKKTKDFAYNQVIRVLDNLAMDKSRLFNKYHLDKTINDEQGRISLWNDGVALLKTYQQIRAIQNFDEKDLEIPQQGNDKDTVIWTMEVNPTVCMEKLYITTLVA